MLGWMPSTIWVQGAPGCRRALQQVGRDRSRRCFFNTVSTFCMQFTLFMFISSRQNRWSKRGLAIIPTKFGISFTAVFLNQVGYSKTGVLFNKISCTFDRNVCLRLQAGALVHIYTDGSVLLTHGGTEMGQGLHTKMVQVPQTSNSLIYSCTRFLFLLHNFQFLTSCLVSGCQQSSGDPLFKNPHLWNKHQHCAQHQPYCCLGLFGFEWSCCAERLWDPRPTSRTVQD